MRGKYERFRGESYRDGGAVTGDMRRSGQFWLLFALFIAVDAGLLPIEQPFATTDPSNLGSRGNYFMLAFMHNVNRVATIIEPDVQIIVTTTESEPVSFTVTTTAFGTTTHTAIAGESTHIELPVDSVQVTRNNQRDRYIKVKADEGKTISVYGVHDEQRSTDGFVALSCDGMEVGIPFERYEYAILSSEIEPSVSVTPTVSEFVVIPCDDDTRIQIAPSQIVTVSASDFDTLRFGPGTSNVQANWEVRRGGTTQRPQAGETLLITHSDDLTGTIIRSSKPVVVLSGHQCAQVPMGFTACDHLVEQIPPQFSWGYTFLMNPLAARESGDIYRVVTVYDDTQVSVTCSDEGTGGNVLTENLGRLSQTPGENWLEYRTTPANKQPCVVPFIRRFCSLQSSNPVAVARYSQGYTVDATCTSRKYTELGDPFMILIAPVVQYINNYLVTAISALAGSFPNRFVSVTVYRTFFQPSQIMLDGDPIEPDATKWNRIYCSDSEVCGYGVYKEVGLGDHSVYHTNENAGLNVELYGFQQQNSYGFPGGMEMQQLSGPIVRCQELYEIPETQGEVTITCTRSLDLNSDTRIRLITEDRTAISTMDYTPIEAALRFRGGVNQETVASTIVEILQDGVTEPTEEFILNVVPRRNVIVLTPIITVRIIGVGGCPALPTIENGAVTETGRNTGDTATYTCNTGYQLVGQPTRTCQANGLWSSSPPICTEPLTISLRIPDARVRESDGSVDVEVLLSRPATEDIELNILLRSGSASAGSDFEDRVIPVLIPAGETSVSVEVAILNDDLVEQSSEEFSVRLQLSSGGGGGEEVIIGEAGEGTVEIVDDDIVIGFEETFYRVAESAGLVRVGVAVLEGAGVFSSGMMESVQLRLNTQSGSALGSADYESTTQDLQFSSTVMRHVVDISILDDALTESIEQFFARLTLVQSDADVQLAPDQTTIEIVDNDMEQVEVELEIENPSVRESDGQVTAVVRLSRAFSEDIQFSINTIDGTATVTSDYRNDGGLGTIPAGTTETQVSFAIVDDNIEEVDVESFGVVLSVIGQPTGVSLGQNQGTVTITDDDSVVIGFEGREYTVDSSTSGQALVGVSVLSGALSRSLEITFQTVDGTATAPADYIATTQVLTFGPGTTRFEQAVTITEGDNIAETIEQFFARISLTDSSTDVDVQLNPSEAAIQIIDNDMVQIGFEEPLYSVSESAGQVQLGVAVLFGALSSDIILSLDTSDGTAQSSQDYTSQSVLLTFSATDTRLTVPISILDDSTNENTEDFFARLQFEVAPSVNVQIQPQQATIRITDDDGVSIGFRETVYSVDESTGQVVVNVEVLSGTLSENVVVRFNTIQGSATAPTDFQSTSRLLTFNAGTTSHNVPILITEDSVNELTEQFSVGLEFASSGVGQGIQLAPDTATITINDNDGVLIGFDRDVYTVSESNGSVTLLVQVLSGQLSEDTVVQLTTTDDTAQATSDYVAVSGQLLTFSSTNTRETVEITVTDDSTSEGIEQFLASLNFVGTPVDGIRLVPNQATVRINDNDRAVIGFERLLYFVEESEGEVVVTVGVQSGTLAEEIVVELTTRSDTATAGGDFSQVTQQLTFSPTNTQTSVSIPIRDDSITELMEQFFASLSFGGNANIQFNPMTAVIMIDDNDGVTIGFDESVYNVGEGAGQVVLGVSVLTGTLSSDLVVSVITMERSATAPEDFVTVSRMLTFSGGVTRLTVPVTIVDDGDIELTEEFVANITLVTTDLDISTTPGQTTVIITDNDGRTPVPEFEFPVYTVSEGGRRVPLCIDVGVAVSEPVSYTITAIHKDPPQAEDADFGTSASVTVAASSSRACIDFTDLVVDDDIALEGTQSFTIVIGTSTAMVNIIDDDIPEPVFEMGVYSVPEGDPTSVPLCVDLGVTLAQPATYTITTQQKVPPQAQDADFGTSASVTVAAFSSRACIDFTDLVVDDAIALEGTQSFTIVIGTSTAMVNIIDDDIPEPVFEMGVYSVPEGDPTSVPLCVDLGVTLAQPATYTITTQQKVPPQAQDADFGTSASVTVAASSSRVCIDFTDLVVDDDIALEGTQSFTIVIGTSTAMVNIIDDDVPDVQAPDVRVSESDGTAEICIKLGNQIENPFSFQYITTVQSANEIEDFIGGSATVQFNPGESEACFEIIITDDSNPESPETFAIDFSFSLPPDMPGNIPSVSSMVTIIDNDVVIVYERTSLTVVEGTDDNVELILTREGSVDLPVLVNFTTISGTAEGGQDYVTVSNMEVVFVAGATKLSFIIPILDDAVLESTESFSVIITSNNPNTIIPDETRTATVTIIDTDRVGVAFDPAEYMVTEGNQRNLRVVVQGSYAIPVEVLLSTDGITARGDEDYIEITEFPVTFVPGGIPQATVPLITLSDLSAEGEEMLLAELSVGTNNFDSSRIDLVVPEAPVTITEEIDPELFFMSESVTVSEGGGSVELCLRLSVPLASPLTVPLIVGTTGTATSGLDYTVVRREVTFEIGTVESCTEVVVVDDSLSLEGEETIVVSFTAPPGTQQGSPPSSTVSILDNDVFIIRFSEEMYQFVEGVGSAEVCLVGEGELAQQAMASLSSPPQGSATDGEDYLPANLGVVFSVGVAESQEVCFPVTIIDDDVAEGEEYFPIEIVSVSQGATFGSPNITDVVIIDNDVVTVRFEEAVYSVVESEVAVVCVIADGRIDSPFTVSAITSDITAVAGVDYVGTDALLQFDASSTSPTQQQCFSVPTIPDSTTELEESFRVTITGSTDSRIVTGQPSSAVVTIQDNDVPVVFFVTESFTVSEDVGTIQICLRLSSPVPTTVTVPLSFNNPATAFLGLDYTVVRREVTFEIGTVESCTEVVVVDDSLSLEGEETIVVSFTAPPGTQQGSPPSSTVSILDNDEFVVRFIEDYSYQEGEGDTVVCVEGVGQTAHPATITISSLPGGTATDGQDYFTVVSQQVTLTPNAPSPQEHCFPVLIFDDIIAEDDEFFILEFESVPAGVVVGARNTTVITIEDNDEVVVRMEEVQYEVTEGGVVEICVLSEGELDSTFTALVQSNDLTAQAPLDYISVNEQLVFASGVNRVCFDVATTSDSVPEIIESFRVALISTSDGRVRIGSPDSAVVQITDEDVLMVRLERVSYTVTEGVSVVVCAILSSPSTSLVTVGLLAEDETASVVEDYGDISGVGFTFQPSTTTDCISISTVDDRDIEGNERFSVSLLTPTSEVMVGTGSPSRASIIILDNEETTTAPPTTISVVCELSSAMQVRPFSSTSTYSFTGVCDHWLVAPTLTTSGLAFSVAVNFATDQPETTINRATVRYGSLELVTTASGEVESSITPLTRVQTPLGFTYTFPGNVVASTTDQENSIEIRDISVTVTHIFSPEGSGRVRIELGDTSLVPGALGLCGDVRGALVIEGTGEVVSDVTSVTQVERFSSSWVLPARLQTSTVESCSEEEMNDTVIADPQFTVSTPGNAKEAICYEFHGKSGRYFNLISDSCTSVNAYFTPMPITTQGNRMSTVGIHAKQSEERLILESGGVVGKCVDIRIELLGCAAFIGKRRLAEWGSEGEIRYRKYVYKGKSHWRVSIPNCEAEDYAIKVTCLSDLLRVDVNRKLHSISSSHGIMGQFWNVPLTITEAPSGQFYVNVNSPTAPNHRHIPARKYSMTWDHHHKTCYYAGNSQGGAEASRDPTESVIEGAYGDYETRGLFDTEFKFKKFDNDVCSK